MKLQYLFIFLPIWSWETAAWRPSKLTPATLSSSIGCLVHRNLRWRSTVSVGVKYRSSTPGRVAISLHCLDDGGGVVSRVARRGNAEQTEFGSCWRKYVDFVWSILRMQSMEALEYCQGLDRWPKGRVIWNYSNRTSDQRPQLKGLMMRYRAEWLYNISNKWTTSVPRACVPFNNAS